MHSENDVEGAKDKSKERQVIADDTETAKEGDDEIHEVKKKKLTKTKSADSTLTKEEPKEGSHNQAKRSVSFNRDVHVKRFGKPRESPRAPPEPPPAPPTVRREPFTHLSKEKLIEEAEKVLAQAESISCNVKNPPDKFFSLPYRKKQKPDKKLGRRKSEELEITSDLAVEKTNKPTLSRTVSDITPPKKSQRTSISTLFRQQKEKLHAENQNKPVSNIKVSRSKSDVSDLKSNTNLIDDSIRKRSGSESEEYLTSIKLQKTQLSPIIEVNPRDDYFKQISLDSSSLDTNALKPDDSAVNILSKSAPSSKINPIGKPPRIQAEKQCLLPKVPKRTKKASINVKNVPEKKEIALKTLLKSNELQAKPLIVDEIDKVREKDSKISKNSKDFPQLKNILNTSLQKDMIHSSQLPAEKLPLTKGQTVEHIVKILKDQDQLAQPPKTPVPTNGAAHNNNQPFSYTKPSVSPDPLLYTRPLGSDENPPSPINKMIPMKNVVYASVICSQDDNSHKGFSKQTVHKKYSPSRQRYGVNSDEDEGLGYEDSYNSLKNGNGDSYDYNMRKLNQYKNLNEGYGSLGSTNKIQTNSKTKYERSNFVDYEPTYANKFPIKSSFSNKFPSQKSTFNYLDTSHRGQADGMDAKRKNNSFDTEKVKTSPLQPNDLSHRRDLLESRMKSRNICDKYDIDNNISTKDEQKYIEEYHERMKATEKYVNETARYYELNKEQSFLEETVEDVSYSTDKYPSLNSKYNIENKNYKIKETEEIDRRQFIDKIMSEEILDRKHHKENRQYFPPEPEYEPPNLEPQHPIISPDEYLEKKYKLKSRHFTSSQDALNASSKYVKGKTEKFGMRREHYASNPEIAQQRQEDIYANARFDPNYPEIFHNSLKREKHIERTEIRYKNKEKSLNHPDIDEIDYVDRRVVDKHSSYSHDISPRDRFDVDRDNKLFDSGIENDFRKDSNGDIHKRSKPYSNGDTVVHKHRPTHHAIRDDSEDEGFASSQLIASEKQHTEDTYYPSFRSPRHRGYEHDDVDLLNERNARSIPYIPRERSTDDGSHYDPSIDRVEEASLTLKKQHDVISKPPKSTKKLTGLEKMKLLFSSSKKSTKKESPDSKLPPAKPGLTRTRVLKSPEGARPSEESKTRYVRVLKSPEPLLARDEELRSRYKEYRGSSDEVDSDYRSPRRSDVSGDMRTSKETLRKTRSKTNEDEYAPERIYANYSHRRRLATPSPPRRAPSPASLVPKTSAGNWFKSLERLSRKKSKESKAEKEFVHAATDNESNLPPKSWTSKSKSSTPITSPTKSLRFFGDSDHESKDSVARHKPVAHTRSQNYNATSTLIPSKKSSNLNGTHEPNDLSYKSRSLSNLHRGDNQTVSFNPKSNGYIKDSSYNSRDLHNISEIQSASEIDSNYKDSRRSKSREVSYDGKPPMSPSNDTRRSRSASSSKNAAKSSSTLKGSKGDLRRTAYENGRNQRNSEERRESSGEFKHGRQELSGHRDDLKGGHRRTPGGHSGDSSTEGEASLQSQRSVVYLHATTVGDIPKQNRSRDDTSSINSSQAKTVSRSFSLLAPWRPRHYGETYDVNYSQKKRPSKRPHKDDSTLDKHKSSSSKNLSSRKYERSPPVELQKNGKSASQTTLNRQSKTPSRLSYSNGALYRKDGRVSGSERENVEKLGTLRDRRSSKEKISKKCISTEVLARDRTDSSSDREKLSRSISMPKDSNKSSGWFRISKKNKKSDISMTRVR